MERVVVPPGWPAEVAPPGTPGWERSATGWLSDRYWFYFHHPGYERFHRFIFRKFTFYVFGIFDKLLLITLLIDCAHCVETGKVIFIVFSKLQGLFREGIHIFLEQRH